MDHSVATEMGVGAAADARIGALIGSVKPRTFLNFECYDAEGNLKCAETTENLVTDEGLNDLLSKYFKGAAYTAAFFVGLKLAGTIAAADTAASHAGWTESS